MKEIQRTKEAIKKLKSFIITAHINPEGDSLGSQLAVANLLKALGKEFIIFNHDKVPSHYQFLPEANLISNKPDIKNKKFDALLVVDCPNLRRTGKVRKMAGSVGTIINIDHHLSNERFGDVNWVEKNASCVGEMIYELFKAFDCEITKTVALYLYIAILTDTGSFNYTNTSGATHEIVSELLGYGIEPYNISKKVYENKTLGELKLLGKVLSDIKVVQGGKVAYIIVRKKLLKSTNTKSSSCENFVNFARSVKGVKVAAFFRESMDKKGKFHVSFRSSGDADVNKVASHFGGGGHKTASGCVVYGRIESVKNRILKRIKHEL